MAGSGTAHLRGEGALLEVRDLDVTFASGAGEPVSAVAGLSFDVAAGETLGIVGESGCGKTTTARAILGLPRPTAGSVSFGGTDLTQLDAAAMREVRPQLQMVHQDPISALNPRRTVREIVAEPLVVRADNQRASTPVRRWFDRYVVFAKAAVDVLARPIGWLAVAGLACLALWVVGEAAEGRAAQGWLLWLQTPAAFAGVPVGVALLAAVAAVAAVWLVWLVLGATILGSLVARRVARLRRGSAPAFAEQVEPEVREVIEMVGLNPDVVLDRLPRELSGGQAQRVCIARALITSPKLLICDEPVSSLDVSIQAQILNLLADMGTQLGLAIVFIAHDLAVVKSVSDQVAVMYRGRLCEVGEPDAVFVSPRHPYTRLLLDSVPNPEVPRRGGASVEEVGSAGVGELVDEDADRQADEGCRFRHRCAHASEVCASEVPQVRELAPGHFAACHYPL